MASFGWLPCHLISSVTRIEIQYVLTIANYDTYLRHYVRSVGPIAVVLTNKSIVDCIDAISSANLPPPWKSLANSRSNRALSREKVDTSQYDWFSRRGPGGQNRGRIRRLKMGRVDASSSKAEVEAMHAAWKAGMTTLSQVASTVHLRVARGVCGTVLWW